MQQEEIRDSETVIQIRDLRVEANIGGRWSEIVKGISLNVARGEVLGIVGESGAGKSTVGLAALGFTKAGCRVAGGEVMFDGQDLLSLSDSRCRALRGQRIAYVAQSAAAAFDPSRQLMTQITEIAVRRGGLTAAQARSRAIDLFRSVQLPDPEHFGSRYPHQVSGGQLQRAMLVMAPICRPDLIIFDEPTTALDVTTQVEVLIAIRKAIAEQGVSAIYISHDLAVVAQIVDRVAVLRYGEVVEMAPIERILNDPQHSYTKTLWAVRTLEKEESPKHGESLLSLRDLSVRYGTSVVLKDVNAEIKRGETVALVGESGSGKSTLGRCIVGLKRAFKGEVIYAGEPLPPTVHERSFEMLKRIQIIYQSAETALNPRQSIRKIIGRPLTFYKGLKDSAREDEVRRLLRLVELEESLIDRRPSQLSGGQRQRVAIARALAADPELIVCDEITSALDQVVQAGILRTLMELQEKLSISYLFITHDIEVVRAIADRVVVMQSGQIVEQGTRDEIFEPPHEPYTSLLLSSVPEMETGWLSSQVDQRASEQTAPDP